VCAVTNQLFIQQDGRCFYCQRLMLPLWDDFSARHPKRRSNNLLNKYKSDWLYPTFEHAIKLKKDGGKRTAENGVCACNMCNWIKGETGHAKFMQMVECESDIINLFLRIGAKPLPKSTVDINVNIKVDVTITKPRKTKKKKAHKYKVANISAIVKGFKIQGGLCCCCKNDMVHPNTVPQDEYRKAKNRPLRYMKTARIVCFACRSVKKNKI